MMGVSYSGDAEADKLEMIVSATAGLDLQEIAGPETTRSAAVKGDFVAASNAPTTKLVSDLETVLREDRQTAAITLTLGSVEREVFVATGAFEPTAVPGLPGEKIAIYAVSKPSVWNGGGGGNVDSLLKTVGDFTGVQVIDGTRSGSVQTAWVYEASQRRRAGPLEVSQVFENVARQTGFSFRKERRRVRVLEMRKGD